MTEMVVSRRLALEYWTPLLLWVGMIYFLSTDAFSLLETSRIIRPILLFFFPGLSPGELQLWHGIIRKLGHVTEYFILGLLTYRSMKFSEPDLGRARLASGIFVMAVALLDEFHQLLTISRTASLVDVGYDCAGGVWALWLFALLERKR